jgi:hypothetical protein
MRSSQDTYFSAYYLLSYRLIDYSETATVSLKAIIDFASDENLVLLETLKPVWFRTAACTVKGARGKV